MSKTLFRYFLTVFSLLLSVSSSSSSPSVIPQQSVDIAKITEVFVYYSDGFPASPYYRIRLYISANNGDGHDITQITITNPNGILVGDSNQSQNAINYPFPDIGMVDYSSFPLATSEGMAISGTYVVTIYNKEGQFETDNLTLRETDFASTFPTIITPLNETSISDNPLISWERYVSPERRIADPDLNTESIWYHIPIYRDDVGNVWNYHIVDPPIQDSYSITYNQGEYQTGYEKLPPGSYTIAIIAYESAERMLGEDKIIFHRASVQDSKVDVTGAASPEDIVKITEVFAYYNSAFPESPYNISLYATANSGNGHDITKITITNPEGIRVGDSNQNPSAIHYSSTSENFISFSSFWFSASEGIAIPGTYVITIYNKEGRFETYELFLSDTDFASTFPTFITPLNGTSISDDPLISWESYVSPERRKADPDLNSENISYHIPINGENVGNIWNYYLSNPPSQDSYSIPYNQGQFKNGYEKLPDGSYVIAINAFETSERMLGEENIAFHRASVQNIQVDVSVNGINDSLFDLDQVYIFNHYSVNYINGEISYQIGLFGHVVNGDNDSIQAISIRNPQSKLIVNQQLQRYPGSVGCTSDKYPLSQLGNLAGEYEFTILFHDGKEEKIKVLLSQTDFVRTYPIVDSPSQNSIIDPAPLISWPPFVSNERKIVDPNLNQETLSYFISWVDKKTGQQCWHTNLNDVPADIPMSVTYNFDGVALPGYESLPVGSYVIDFWCYESDPDRNVNQDVYSFMRGALVAVDVRVQEDGSQIPNTIDLPEKIVYVTSENTNSLLRLDFKTGVFIIVYQGSLSWPHELIQNDQGVIYITNLDSGTVTRLESGVPPKNMFAGNQADGLSLGPNNSIYVALTNQRIIQLSDSGTILKTLTPPDTASIHSMNYDQKDSIFVPANGQLFRYSISKGQWDTIAANVGMVNELTWDKEGNLLASNLEGLLKVYSPEGLLLKQISMPSTHMRTVIQSSNGYYVVADAENNRILVTDEEGKILASFNDPVLLNYPIGLLFPNSEYQPSSTKIREWELY